MPGPYTMPTYQVPSKDITWAPGMGPLGPLDPNASPPFVTTPVGSWMQLHKTKLIIGGLGILGFIAIELMLRKRAAQSRN